jgi:hypothetical protein
MTDITAYREELESKDQDELDDLVISAKEAEAAEINNQGREAQIAYLMGEEDKVTFNGPTLTGGALVLDSDTFKKD